MHSAASSVYKPEEFKDDSLYLVYIDDPLRGKGYTQTHTLIQSWYPKLVDGGFMIGHDISDPEVSEAVYWSFSSELNITDEVWMAQKNAV